jgi:hypothetical protein
MYRERTELLNVSRKAGMEKCYSTDQEEFIYSELADAIERAWDSLDHETPVESIGAIVTVYEGDSHPYNPLGWLPDMVEYMGERAYDDGGEFASDWPPASKEQSAELQADVERVVTAWLEKHSMQPMFWSVINVKEVRARITSETGDYELIEGAVEA